MEKSEMGNGIFFTFNTRFFANINFIENLEEVI